MTLSLETTILLENESTSTVTLCVEPWGTEYPVPGRTGVEVRVTAESPGRLHLALGSNRWTMYGWTGSTISVLEDGVDRG